MTSPSDGGAALEVALHPGLQHHIANTLGWPDLRPLQRDALEPIIAGHDALLIAPTAGGKTEAAFFPLLTRMLEENWTGISVLYVCPLRALLNNLEPRLTGYAGWVGRRVALRHGDTTAGARKRITVNRPDVLLTTPESLESMLVSTLVTPHELFADLRAVVIDEVHAFAGDDRGWHLLAVLERLARLAGRPLQRIALSATVGNPDSLLGWVQGSGAGERPATVVRPRAIVAKTPALQLDYVGSLENAARVVSALHRGEKRLIFAESRRSVEALAVELRILGVETFVSHSSLALDERRRAEAAFASARDCVIVSTSTLELGIDVGDLDRVLQVGAPGTVSSYLQRIGRTGRRPDTERNLLFLAVEDDELIRAAALLLLAGEGYVEPVSPPPLPRHILAQQLLALCLQEGQVGSETWQEWLGSLPLTSTEEAAAIAANLVDTDQLHVDSGMLFVGDEAERRYGRRHFLELLSVFTSSPEFTVLHGHVEIGTVDPVVMTRKVDGDRVISLGGRSWLATYTDWTRRRVFVEPSQHAGKAQWGGLGRPLSYAVSNAMRRVLLGADAAGVAMSRRATAWLPQLREAADSTVDVSGTVVHRHDANQLRWWTWGGSRANGLLGVALSVVSPGLVDELDRYDNRYVKLRGDATVPALREALAAAQSQFGADFAGIEPSVNAEAVRQLKFGDLLPPHLAMATLGARGADHPGAQAVAETAVVSHARLTGP